MKINKIGYVILGAILYFIASNLFKDKIHAKTNNDPSLHIIESKPIHINESKPIRKTNNENYVNFELAADISIKSVVHIKSKFLKNEIFRYYDPFYGNRYFNHPQEKSGSGSGVIISSDGYIITNRHVINEAKEIEVVLNDKRTYIGEIIGEDQSTDLALIKIKAKNLPSLKFANSDNINIGQWVLAVGNPFNLNSTVTAGIISAKSRKINILNDGGIEAFIQTDAAINPGNSGGALVNTNGELIGINTAIQSNTGSYTGYGFAIPANMVQKIFQDLKVHGVVKRAYIGIHITDITNDIKKHLQIDNLSGVLISKVLKGSAAEKAGIRDHDVILNINGKDVNSTSEIHEQIIQFSPGDEIICTIKRDNKIQKMTIYLQS
ncbi:MAG: hypothetical protein CMP73_04085 [Flavobacteriales bacterium]|nr:hypothetical protein [Flavobacteriales bacterium]